MISCKSPKYGKVPLPTGHSCLINGTDPNHLRPSWDDPPKYFGSPHSQKGFLANSHPSPCPLSRSLPHSRWREKPGSFTLRKLRRCKDEKLEQTCTPSIPPIYGVHITPRLCTCMCIYIYIRTFTHVYKYIYIYICFHMFEDSFHLRERKKARGFPISDHLFLRFHIGAKGDVDLESLSWH